MTTTETDLLARARTRAAAAGYRRQRRGRLIAGVCAGLARKWGMRVWTVRVAAVVSLLLPGPQVLAYVALWIALPLEPREEARG